MHTSERALLGLMVRPIVTAIVCGLLLSAAGLIHRDFMADLELGAMLAKRVFLGRFLFSTVPSLSRKSASFST